MKRILALTTVLLSSYAIAQESAHPPPLQQKEQGQTLPDYISQIAEADEVAGADFHNMASGTLQVAETMKQQGQELPKPVLNDALNAVAAGRELSPALSGWDELEQKLLELLNPPEEEQQQQQDQQNSDENSESQEGEQDQQQQGESGEQEQQDSEDGEQSQNQDGQQEQSGEQEQQQDGESQEGQNQDSQNDQNSQSGEQGQNGDEGELPQAKDGAQMGELEQPDQPQDVQLDGQEQDSPQQQQQQPEEMQTLGGQQTAGEPIQADKAAIRQMLEQLKQQDEPGKLYKILQEAQQGKRQKSQPNAKDW